MQRSKCGRIAANWQNTIKNYTVKVAKNLKKNRIRGAPCKVGLFVDLSKVNSQLVLHSRSGDFQHPCSRVQLPLDGWHPWHPLHAPPHSLLTDQLAA